MSKPSTSKTPTLPEPRPPRNNTLAYALTALIFFTLGFLIAGLIGFEIIESDPLQDERQIQGYVIGTLTALTPTASPPPTSVPIALTYSAEDNFTLGADNAPVKMVEFSDYQCPYCAGFTLQTLEPLMEIYDGYVQFVHRDFPILGYNTDPDMSMAAAQAAICAGQQDKFWEFHHTIFEHQQEARISFDMLFAVADELQIEPEAFNTCLQDDTIIQRINADFEQGLGLLGNAGTPTFLINGTWHQGNNPIAYFIQAINAELEKLGIEPPAEALAYLS